ncbi:chaperonin 10-like protein [Aspergillus leporis]|uniref:Chaperonin 10-like protein n=1 Tax=Aspergillus leporis TaxID=41062 RepID=A0A5N5WJ56_9EURO|nr:chaperonin 10-like protein [Aspergillus leporis]
MTIPQTYKQAVFKSAGAPLVIEEAPLTPPGPNEILVKVEACGVCFSDVFAQNNVMGGGFPIVPGHEIVGRVAAVGDNVSGWTLGDRIGGAWHGGHDGTCKACRKGWYQMCGSQVVNGETKNGGYAEYCLLNHEAAVRVPSHVPAAKYAPILCAGVSVFNSLRHMNIPVGETVAIQGLGGLGHLAIQYANKMGYRVVAISRDAKKERLVRELGAHEYIDSSQEDAGTALQKLGGASLVVSTAPTAEVMSPLLKGLGILGKLLILSVPGEVPIDTVTMLKYALSVQVWPSGHATDSEEAIAFTELHNINCKVEEFPLEKANEAYEAMLKGTVRFRAVIIME